jgi:hypothetical protein
MAEFYLVLFFIIGIALLCWQAGSMKIRLLFKSCIVIVFVLSFMNGYNYYYQMLGAAIEEYPPNDSLYVHHDVQVVSNEKSIFVWVIDKINKLYVIEYSEAIKKRLDEAKKRQKENGRSQTIVRKSNNNFFLSERINSNTPLYKKDN